MTSHILSKLYWPLTPAPSSRVQDEPWAWELARDLHPLVWWILLGVALGFAASSYFYHRRVLVLRSLGRKQSGLLLAHAGVPKGAPVFYQRISTSSRTEGWRAMPQRILPQPYSWRRRQALTELKSTSDSRKIECLSCSTTAK